MRSRKVRCGMSVWAASCLLVVIGGPAWSQNTAKSDASKGTPSGPIVLVAGEIAKKDTLGHHDYLGGIKVLEMLLRQTRGTEVRLVDQDWPADASILDSASAVVFYTDGGGKQAFLSSPERIAVIDRLAAKKTGLVFIHQAVDFPADHAARAKTWLGGIYLQGKSGRGHWPSTHVDFPDHPIARGVTPWKVNDGWLNKIDFVSPMSSITPLVWSGKEYAGSRSGLDPDIVGWAYDRPSGGRSFCFSGLDAHSAWSLTGMRQLVTNGVLWTAGHEIPSAGAPCEADEKQLEALQTPREPKTNAKS